MKRDSINIELPKISKVTRQTNGEYFSRAFYLISALDLWNNYSTLSSLNFKVNLFIKLISSEPKYRDFFRIFQQIFKCEEMIRMERTIFFA